MRFDRSCARRAPCTERTRPPARRPEPRQASYCAISLKRRHRRAPKRPLNPAARSAGPDSSLVSSHSLRTIWSVVYTLGGNPRSCLYQHVLLLLFLIFIRTAKDDDLPRAILSSGLEVAEAASLSKLPRQIELRSNSSELPTRVPQSSLI